DRFDLPVHFRMLQLQVSGHFTANDPAAAQWQVQLNTLSPPIDDDPNEGRAATAMAYVATDNLARLKSAGDLQPETEVWVPVQPSATNAEALTAQMRALIATTHRMDTPGGGTCTLSLEFSAGLITVLDRAIDRWHGTAAVLAM